MKVKSLIVGAAVAATIPAVALSGSALAAAVGQIEGGDIYRVRNVTKNTDFTDPAAATCGEMVQFKVRIHNPGPDALKNVNVKATLPSGEATSHSSKVTVTAENANPSTTTDTAGVNLSPAGSLNYVAGSTELLDAHNSKLNTLPDTITGAGVNIGTVGVSTEQKRFVQFQAKVNCPTPPVTPPTTPTTPATPAAPGQPTTLVNTGAGSIAAIFAAAMAAGVAAYRVVLGRRLSRQ